MQVGDDGSATWYDLYPQAIPPSPNESPGTFDIPKIMLIHSVIHM
jgi:hypothetical protein